MEISKAAKMIARCAEFIHERQAYCITETCERVDECKNGYCILGAEFVQAVLNEAAAEKDAKFQRLKDAANAYIAATRHFLPCQGTLDQLEQALSGEEE